MNTTEEPVGYLCVFDREKFDTERLIPSEPFPARFKTMEEAAGELDRFRERDRKKSFSIFEHSIPPFLVPDGVSQVNPDWQTARFELRLVSKEQLVVA